MLTVVWRCFSKWEKIPSTFPRVPREKDKQSVPNRKMASWCGRCPNFLVWKLYNLPLWPIYVFEAGVMNGEVDGHWVLPRGNMNMYMYNCSHPGCSDCEISQARILEWVDISFSRESSHVAGRFFTTWATREVWMSLLAQIKQRSLTFGIELRFRTRIYYWTEFFYNFSSRWMHVC